MKQDFVVFFSPGTFVAETTQKPIDSWDPQKAKELSKAVKERHGATPYGFHFITRERADDELDSKVTKRSNMYYLGGDVLTLEDVEKRNDPKDETLLWNMRINSYDKIIEITTDSGYKTCQVFNKGDVRL